MNQELVDKVVQAVLYEGFILYPYRPSVKNHQRWTFGGLYPQSGPLAVAGDEPSVMQTQCLVKGDSRSMISVEVRFLHLIARTVGELQPPLAAWPLEGEPLGPSGQRLSSDRPGNLSRLAGSGRTPHRFGCLPTG